MRFNQTVVYFAPNEYITKLKVIGKAYITALHIETSKSKRYKIGNYQPKDKGYEFKIPEACKVIAFAGVIEVLYMECRLLNL